MKLYDNILMVFKTKAHLNLGFPHATFTKKQQKNRNKTFRFIYDRLVFRSGSCRNVFFVGGSTKWLPAATNLDNEHKRWDTEGEFFLLLCRRKIRGKQIFKKMDLVKKKNLCCLTNRRFLWKQLTCCHSRKHMRLQKWFERETLR